LLGPKDQLHGRSLAAAGVQLQWQAAQTKLHTSHQDLEVDSLGNPSTIHYFVGFPHLTWLLTAARAAAIVNAWRRHCNPIGTHCQCIPFSQEPQGMRVQSMPIEIYRVAVARATASMSFDPHRWTHSLYNLVVQCSRDEPATTSSNGHPCGNLLVVKTTPAAVTLHVCLCLWHVCTHVELVCFVT